MYIESVGNEIYDSENYVINLSKSEFQSGYTLNGLTLVLGKRCKDVKNISGTTSQYYVHKHKLLTGPTDYLMDYVGFENPIFEDEKKLLYQNSRFENDVLVERNRMEAVLFDFKETFQLTGITNNLGYTPTEVYVTTILRNKNGYFNYPPKVGFKFNFHDTWIDNIFSGTTSYEKSLTGTTQFSGATTGFTFSGGTAIPKGTTLVGDFIEYNDLGLPLAFAIAENIVEVTPVAEQYVNETWDLFLAGLEIEDLGFDTLDQMLDSQE